MINIDEFTATGRMQRELDSLNPVKNSYVSSIEAAIGNGFPTFDFMNNSAMFSASSAIQKSIESMGISNMFKDSLGMSTAISRAGLDCWQKPISFLPSVSLQNAMESFSCTSAIKDAMALRKIAGIDGLENIHKMLGTSSLLSVQTMVEPLAGITELRKSFAERATAGFGVLESLRKSVESLGVTSIVQQASMSMFGLNSLQESLGFRMSSVQSALRSLQHSKMFSDADYMAKAIGVFSSSQAFRDTIVALNQRGAFQEALNHYNSVAYALSDEDGIPADELAASLPQMGEALEHANFIELFRKLPPFVQSIIIFIFMQSIWPLFINVASALIITPSVERFINGTKLNTDQVRIIKKLPASQGIDIENLRFVTRNNVKLRAKASTKSEMLDELVVGQVVTVLGKNKNWAEVVYRYDDGQAFHGWILTTYTAKFKNHGSGLN